jgi:peptidoglycan/LPS O-acetylase OafA/YrhL
VTTAKSSTAFQIPSLDGIRMVSFSIVFLAHAGLNWVIPGPFGVTIFFFLSGYLITTLLRKEREKTGGTSLKLFYWRRILRILPPFYTVLLIVFAGIATGVLPPATEPASIWALLLHYVNYYIVVHDHHGLPMGTGVYWSLAVEEHFYLVFPWIYIAMFHFRLSVARQVQLLLALCALTLIWRCVLVFGFHPSFHRTGVATDTRFDSLLFGCILALWQNPALDSSLASERALKWLWFPLGLFGLLACFAIRNDTFRETFRYSIQGMSLIPVFICAVRYPQWAPFRPLNWRPIAYLGSLSYSLYLVHLLCQDVLIFHFQHTLGAVVRGALAAVMAFVLSWLIFQVVEKPCATLRARFRA